METYVACTNCNKINRVKTEALSKGPKCGHCGTEFKFHGFASEATAAGLSQLIKKSPLPVVVDFWAPWCAPCRVFAPVFEQVSRKLAGQAVFVKVDTEANPMAGDLFGIRGIPTLILFSEGLEKERTSGAMPADAFVNWLIPQL